MGGASNPPPPPVSGPPEWKYDVFVSFRGRVARRKFMSHLFHAFELAEIRCYHDVDWDQRGRIVESMLLDAIRGSRIALILFTTDYADSHWCLDEVVEIMRWNGLYRDHRHMVVPIFFEVEPTDVRRQSGVFGRGFESCTAEHGEAKVPSWRAALVEAGCLSGWHLMNDANGDESELIKKIVGRIFKETSFTNSPYFIRDAVGRDENASAVISLLDVGSDDVRVIGLYGIRGIGKTTLAKLVCSRIYFEFEGVSFLENIGDAKRERIIKFQKKLLNDVLKVKRQSLDENDCNRNLDLIRDKLCKQKILLVLDNVKEKMQVTLLGGRRGSLGPGSRILITTENEVLLDQTRVNYKCMVSGLGPEESYQLFSRYAFDGDDDDNDEGGHEALSKNLVHYAGGFPLAIKTLGTCLFGRTRDQWSKLLEHLVQNPNLDWIEAYSGHQDSFLSPYKSKVGPYGGTGGSSKYDDKGYKGIRQMKIAIIAGKIGSIRIDYDHNGSLVRTSQHGGPHADQMFTVALDYPDEFVTSISGCIDTDLRVIQSLTIHSNLDTYGPFGEENENTFSFPEQRVEGGKIIGFYGKCDSYVNSIGAYVGPTSHPYPFKVVGPFGHRKGDSWDDGKHADIRQIDVVFGSKFESISIIYDNYGHSASPFTHGEEGGGRITSVKLDYPYEYLTWISGYLREDHGTLIIQSVSFHSITTKYGPFGQEIGIPFSSPSSGGKIVGFYGSCDGHLESIGVYLEPVSHEYPARNIGPFGGNGGSPWDDGQHSGLRQIVIKSGWFIDSIEFVYDEDGIALETTRHGGDGGSQIMVQLDYPDECLISISGYMDQWGPNYLVRSLTFESNKGVHGPYGLQEGTYFSSPPNIGKIVGFYGRCALYLNCIGAYFAPAFHMEPIRKIGPYGGEGGSPWDDGRHTGLRQVFLSCGLVIDSICCVYDTGEKSDQRGGSGESSLTIELDYPDEYLTSMSGNYGFFCACEVVTSLTFQSNKSTYGPFGSGGGKPFSFTSGAGKIVGFFGRSGIYLDSIGAYVDASPSN